VAAQVVLRGADAAAAQQRDGEQLSQLVVEPRLSVVVRYQPLRRLVASVQEQHTRVVEVLDGARLLA
jgi:hypothetical protein